MFVILRVQSIVFARWRFFRRGPTIQLLPFSRNDARQSPPFKLWHQSMRLTPWFYRKHLPSQLTRIIFQMVYFLSRHAYQFSFRFKDVIDVCTKWAALFLKGISLGNHVRFRFDITVHRWTHYADSIPCEILFLFIGRTAHGYRYTILSNQDLDVPSAHRVDHADVVKALCLSHC